MKKLLIVFLLLAVNIIYAKIPKPQKNTYVNDFAHVLSADEVTDLNKKIFRIEKASGVQVAVILVNKVPPEYDIQDFAVLIGRKWHVGNQQKGIVYVAAIQQRKQRLEVAHGLDSVFNGPRSLEILSAMKPQYAAKNYYAGLSMLVDSLSAELIPPPVVKPVLRQLPKSAREESHTFLTVLGIITCVVILIILFRLISKPSSGNLNTTTMRNNIITNSRQYGGSVLTGHTSYSTGHTNYNNGYNWPHHHSGAGAFAAGAAVGAVAGYAASSIQDSLANNNQAYIAQNNIDNTPPDDSEPDNNSSNWGNWGSSDSSSSSSYDDSSSSDYSDSSSDSSSSDDSGYSDSDSSDSGSTTDW